MPPHREKSAPVEGGRTEENPDQTEERLERAGIVDAPDGGYGWVVVLGSFLINLLVDGVIFTLPAIIVPLWEREFDAPTSAITLCTSLLGGCYLLSGPLASILANNFGCNRVAIAGSVVAVVGILLSVLVPALPVLYLTFGIIGGVGYGLIYLPAIVIVGQYFSTRRALATGIAVCGSGIGTTLFGFINPIVLEAVGGSWRLHLTFIAAATLLCALFANLFRPLKPSKEQIDEVAEIAGECLNLKEQTNGIDGDSGVALSAANVTAGLDESPAFESDSRLKYVAPGVQIERIERDTPPTGAESRHVRSTALCTSRPFLSTIELHAVNLRQAKAGPFARREREQLARLVSEASITELNRPLTRMDIFYGRSSNNLTLRQDSYGAKTSCAGRLTTGGQGRPALLLSTLTLTALADATAKQGTTRLRRGQLILSLRSMLSLELFQSPSFLMLALGSFLTLACFFVPFIFIGELAKQKGVDPELTKYLLMILGLVNLTARVISGMVADHTDPLTVSNWAIILGGVATMAAPLLTEFWMFALLHCLPFASGVACFASLRSIICVDLLGIERLTNAYGMLLPFMGIAALIGPPLAAALKTVTGSFDASFYAMGAVMVLSGVLGLPLRRINQWESARTSTMHTGGDLPVAELEPLRTAACQENGIFD